MGFNRISADQLRRAACLLSCIFILLSTQAVAWAYTTGGDSGNTNAAPIVAGPDATPSDDTPAPDLFTGTMSYSLSIDVPPGRRGMKPGLSLTYKSNNGNSWTGVGWNLVVGFIERSTKGGVDYTGDQYLMHGPGGSTELVNIPDTSEYRAKIEGSFTKYIKNGDYWTATDKNGTRFTFGQASDNRQYDPSDATKIFLWCIERIEDTNGNYITFSYTKDNNQVYLHRIDYTGGPALSATNYVLFNLEDRTDAPTMYTLNFPVKTAKRLSSIEIYANSSLVRKYLLSYTIHSHADGNISYSPLTKRSLLGSITEYGSDGSTAKPPVTFGYSNDFTDPKSGSTASGGSFITSLWAGLTPHVPIGTHCLPGEFNSNSKLDLACYTGSGNEWNIAYSTGNNWQTTTGAGGFEPPFSQQLQPFIAYIGIGNIAPFWQHCITGDFSGDGKTGFNCSTGGGSWAMAKPSVMNWATTTWPGGPTYSNISECFSGDFDGNGKTDIACYSGGGVWKMAISTGSGWNTAQTQWSGPNPGQAARNVCLSGDFNGDGKTDLACFISGAWQVYLSTGTSWTQTAWNGGSAPSTPVGDQCLTGDFNGDGKTDIACYISNAWQVSLSTGKSFDTTTWSSGPSVIATPVGNNCVTGDFNGDGRTDIACNTGVYHWSVALSIGDGWNTHTWDGPQVDYSANNNFNNAKSLCIVGDIDGDGKTDISCYYWGGGTWYTGVAVPLNDLLTSVSNGLGGLVSIEYTPSTKYKNDYFSNEINNTLLRFPIQTASKVTVSDGNGNNGSTTYFYSGGYYHAGQKEFRGFNKVTSVGPQGPNGLLLITEIWFHQGDDTSVDSNDPSVTVGYMKGKPYRTRVWSDSGVYSETEITYKALPIPNNNPYFFNPPETVDTYNCDGTGTSACNNVYALARHTRNAYTYDEYGNVTREDKYGNVTTPGNRQLNMTVTRAFSPNTTNWILGLPATESIYQGIGIADADKIRQTDYYYDGVTDCSTASTNQTPTIGNLTRIARWYKEGSTISETRMAYDDLGNPICVRDPNGNVSSVAYDTSYKTFPISNTNAKNQTSTSTFCGINSTKTKGQYGQAESTTDPNNATVTAEYDKLGRKTKSIQPDLFQRTTAYNSFGTVGNQNIYQNNQLNLWAANYFDGLGRTFKTKRSGPDNKVIVTETIYDSRGKVYKTSLPYFESLESPVYRTYTYDSLGRPTQIANPDGTISKACYSDLITVFIDENGHRKRETRDPLGRLVTVEEYTGIYSNCTTSQLTPYATTTYAYDVTGSLTGITSNGKSTQIQYDSLGRKKNMTDPDMGYWEYGYYPDGTLYSVKDANNNTITYDIDALNRPTRKRYPTGANVGDVFYNYDEPASTNAIGRLSSMTDASGSARLHYDSSGKVTTSVKRIDETDYTIGKAYDGLGRMTSLTYPDNETVDYYYDTAGNLFEIMGYAAFTGYNALGQPGTITYANGIVSNYRYYPINYRLFSARTDRLQTPIQSRTYNYDAIGNISYVLDLVNPSTPHNTTYGTVNFTLDPTRAHAVGSVNGTVFQYDNNGNMTSDGTRTVVYTPDNLPYSITNNNATTRFVYDGSGQRVKKIAGSNRQYIGKLYECVDYINCSKYIFAGNTRIALEDDNGTTYYYHPDHLGSTSVVTDDFGNTLEQIAYYPFGETRQDTGSYSLNHKYTGQELDNETNLYDYGARMYCPETGRFISPDSIVPDYSNPQSLNRYAYVQNNPMRLVDPTGHNEIDSENAFFGSGNDYDIGGSEWGQRDAGDGVDLNLGNPELASNNGWGDGKTSFLGNLGNNMIQALPGQVSGKNAISSFGSGDYLNGIIFGTTAILDDALFALSFGTSSLVSKTATAISDVTEAAVARGLSVYEVGSYKGLQKLSTVGDDLALHHAGQAHLMEQVVPGFTREGGAAIALPTSEHLLIPTIKGTFEGSARSLLASDISNLRNFTNVPNSSLMQLIELNKKLYPRSFVK